MLRAVKPEPCERKRYLELRQKQKKADFHQASSAFWILFHWSRTLGLRILYKARCKSQAKVMEDTQQHKMTDHRIGIERKVNWVLCWKDGRVSC